MTRRFTLWLVDRLAGVERDLRAWNEVPWSWTGFAVFVGVAAALYFGFALLVLAVVRP